MNEVSEQEESSLRWQVRILTLAGAIPFLLALCLVVFPQEGLDGAAVATSYAALIIAFLSGTLWMQVFKAAGSSLLPLLLKSNVVTLVAWGAWLFGSQRSVLALHGACFLYLLFLDHRLWKAGHLPQWYYSVRRGVTLIVVTSLLLVIGALSV